MKKIFILLVIITMPLAFLNLKAVDDLSAFGASGGEFTKIGAAGGQFLKIPVGARATGMGGAYGAVANDLSSIFWNPAGLAEVSSMAADFSYTQWFATYSHNFGAIAMPIGDGYTAAFSVVSLSSGDINVTTVERPEGTGSIYQVNDISVGASFSGYLTDQFSFGVTVKYIQNAFSSVAASGFAFDIGTKYDTGIQGIKLGFSMHNLSTQQRYDGTDLRTSKKLEESLEMAPLDATYLAYPFNLPIIFRAGVTTDIIDTDEHKLLAAADFVTLTDIPEQFMLGAEYVWNDFLAVRAGYVFGQNSFGIAGGVGLKYFGGAFGGTIDYSINPSVNLGLVNRLTIALNFGS
ncbi:MAG: PorV/PorQ family protein [Candidatus Kapabacteria bacterium]|nr:PorV/PorQ family protein [Ignavibacteriota bacterium]MCW5883907.1 PorV/PorQ family protein [Candidatus Kapabacteria bacterium]